MDDLNHDVDEKLSKLLLRIFEVEQINLNASMDDIPEWDSFKHFELIVNIEKEFKIKLAVADTTEITSIPIIKTKIMKYLEKTNSKQ